MVGIAGLTRNARCIPPNDSTRASRGIEAFWIPRFSRCAGAQPHVDNWVYGANPGARCVKNSEKPERFGRGLLGRPPKGKIAT